MADLKISELTAATSVSAADSIVIVQSGETRRVTPSVLFGNAPAATVCKESAEVVISGAISPTILTTIIDSAVYADAVLTLGAGTHGHCKEIVVSALVNSFTATLTVTNGKGFTTLTFTGLGQTAQLKNINGYWYVFGYKGVTIA